MTTDQVCCVTKRLRGKFHIITMGEILTVFLSTQGTLVRVVVRGSISFPIKYLFCLTRVTAEFNACFVVQDKSGGCAAVASP